MWRVTRWAPLRKAWVLVEEVPDEHTAARSVRALADQGLLAKAAHGNVSLTAHPSRPARPYSFARYETLDNRPTT